MCGIIFAADTRPVDQIVSKMHAAQTHRGPDSSGVEFEQAGDVNLGFAHERLSIVDLSETGSQPMESASGRSLIIFNGEIYNFLALAKFYGLKNLRSSTDTEVALELIEMLGITEASKLFNGMWSIVFYDRKEGVIHLSRDRFGKKPLHIARLGTGIFISSEIYPLLKHPDISTAPDLIVAARFLNQSIQNADCRTWLRDVQQLPAATTATINIRDAKFPIVSETSFWSPSFEAPESRSDADWIEELRETTTNAIDLRLNADVPVGIALSGGLDSTVIASAAFRQKSTNQNIHLFSATSKGSADDESDFIDIAEKALNVKVQRYDLQLEQSEDFLGSLYECIRHNDGPIASFSPMLFYKLMGMAKQIGVTVVLTGQGADEGFCGYRKYPFFQIKKLLKEKRLLEALQFGGAFARRGTLFNGFKLAEAKRYIGKPNAGILGEACREVSGSVDLGGADTIEARQWRDISSLSVPYLCHYEDRLSMAHSREVRAPFLDYRVIELGLQMPLHLKMQKGWTKYALRKAFASKLPSEIAWRKDKKGFVNPQDDLFRGPLQSVVREIMFDENAQVYTEGLVDHKAYMAMFDKYCAGDKRIWFREVFAPFATEIWLKISQQKMAI